MKKYRLAIIGFGGVTRALAQLIAEKPERFHALGLDLQVSAISDLAMGSLVQPAGIDLAAVLAMPRGATFDGLPGGSATADNEAVISSAPAEVVIEATFTNPATGQPATDHVRWALTSGKHVATTNKGPIALHGAELNELARRNGVRLAYEGAVLSGTPVLGLARNQLAGLTVNGFDGILNGTSNYVLHRMAQGLSLEDAVAEAQTHGYAEADPTADIGGSDVQLKVAILANELLGADLCVDQVPTTGITAITADDIATATREGRSWKLIGSAHRGADGRIAAQVHPVALDPDHPLAHVPAATNAITFHTDLLGAVTITGPGAGRVETAYALIADLVAIHTAHQAGSAHRSVPDGPQRSTSTPEATLSATRPTTAAAADLVVLDKFTGDEIARLAQHTVSEALEVVERSSRAAALAAAMTRYERATILDRAAALVQQRADQFANLIVAEAGKTIRQAHKEVARAANTLHLSAAEATRNAGEVIPFDSFPGGETRRGWYTREPLGLVVAITPYNDPLNLVAHKLGPAIAAGNAVILKPAQQTPLTAQLLVDVLVEAGLSPATVAVVRGDRHVAQALIQAREVRMVSFTGGFATGRAISAAAGIKRLAMELGGNAPVLVFADADLDRAVDACVSGSFWAAGQNCIGAQRILVHHDVYNQFLADFVAATQRLVTDDPRNPATDVGPMISPTAAAEARAKIAEAVNQGATLLTGGQRTGSLLTPAVLTGVARTCRLWEEEVFAPIVIIDPFSDETGAIAAANDSEYALQAGVFTADLNRALRVADAIDAGGVMINDSSDYRLDAMPFGGSKYGSMGREGVRFAYEEMTQPKVVAIAS